MRCSISSHFGVYTMGAHGRFLVLFSKNFRMSGYDNWSWITISCMRVHFETIRHPLFLTLLYPLYWLNHWLIKRCRYQLCGILYGNNHCLFSILFCYFSPIVSCVRCLNYNEKTPHCSRFSYSRLGIFWYLRWFPTIL